MQDDVRENLKIMTEHAEMHASSVRQLIAQRTRIYKLLELSSRFPGMYEVGLPALLGSIETSRSQMMQDIFALAVNRVARGGFFVEFGACDGLLISNTYLLEKEFGWSGILSEPAKSWQSQLKANRSCAVDERCVWSETGKFVTFGEYEYDQYLTQSSVLDEERSGQASTTYEVETISLFDLLEQHNAPKNIGLLSIDVEGGEYEILKGFPFENYRFEMMCIEHKTLEEETAIKGLLEKNHYRQVLRSISSFDGFYVPIDSEALPYFSDVTPIGKLAADRPAE